MNRKHEHHRLLKGLPASKSATKQHLKKKIRKAYKKEFRMSPRYERASRFDPKTPVSNFMKIATKLTRHQASVLAQLRSSHAPSKHIYTASNWPNHLSVPHAELSQRRPPTSYYIASPTSRKDDVYGAPWAETRASVSKYWVTKNGSDPL